MKSTLFALLSLMYAVDVLGDTPNVSARIDYGAVRLPVTLLVMWEFFWRIAIF